MHFFFQQIKITNTKNSSYREYKTSYNTKHLLSFSISIDMWLKQAIMAGWNYRLPFVGSKTTRQQHRCKCLFFTWKFLSPHLVRSVSHALLPWEASQMLKLHPSPSQHNLSPLSHDEPSGFDEALSEWFNISNRVSSIKGPKSQKVF